MENSKKDQETDGVREDFQQYLSRSKEGNVCIFTEKYIDCSGGEVTVAEEIMKYNRKSS